MENLLRDPLLKNSITVECLGKCYRLGKRTNQMPWLTGLASAFGVEAPSKRPPRELWALRDVSLQLEPGTILGVIGANGAGKSTLLKILGRVTKPTEGRALLRGRVASLLEVGSGFQRGLSGRENIFLYAALYGIPRAEITRRFDDIVEFAELGGFIDTPVHRYSSGMYLRLAFSAVLNMQPAILLADEVLAVGDLSFQEQCLRRVEEAGASGMTVLFVSHDMAAIARLCQSVMWLHGGHMMAYGAPDEIINRYQREAWTLLGKSKRKNKAGGQASAEGEILGARLLSSTGTEIGAARVDESISIEVNYRLRRPRLRARCSIDVYAGGLHAFRSFQPEPWLIDQTGDYSATVQIPSHFLADTVYTANVGLILQDEADHETSLVEYNAVTFQVFDASTEEGGGLTHGKRRLAGVVAPRLEWRAGVVGRPPAR